MTWELVSYQLRVDRSRFLVYSRTPVAPNGVRYTAGVQQAFEGWVMEGKSKRWSEEALEWENAGDAGRMNEG